MERSHPRLPLASRRQFLFGLGATITGAIALSACQAPPAPAPAVAPTAAAPKPAATSAPAPPTAAANSQVLTNPEQVKPLAQRQGLKLTLPSNNFTYFALMYALDRGYFQKAGLDLDAQTITVSSTTLLPLLARGDIDVGTTTPSPATFNQVAQNFDIRVIVEGQVEKVGRMDSWLTVLKDRADQIKDLKDLKGKTIEAGLQASPFDIAAISAVQMAGLDPSKDVTLTYRVKGSSDLVTLAQNKAADVIVMNEPTASQAEQQGFVVRWKQMAEVAAWYRAGQLAASSNALSSKRPALAKLLEVYVVTCRQINAANGAWTDDLLQTATKWGQMDQNAIKAIGPVPYFDPNGEVSLDSLQRAQQFVIDQGQLKQAVDVKQLVATEVLDEALSNVGRASA